MNPIIKLACIGLIKTPHKSMANMPIQPIGAGGIKGCIELNPAYAPGLTDIEGFSHLILLYYLHEAKGYSLMVKPFMDDKTHGVFATRAPRRPSPIGLSTVRLISVEENKIYFEGADMLDGTPLMDIKPFFRQIDNRMDALSGWLDQRPDSIVENTLSDTRFITSTEQP